MWACHFTAGCVCYSLNTMVRHLPLQPFRASTQLEVSFAGQSKTPQAGAKAAGQGCGRDHHTVQGFSSWGSEPL